MRLLSNRGSDLDQATTAFSDWEEASKAVRKPPRLREGEGWREGERARREGGGREGGTFKEGGRLKEGGRREKDGGRGGEKEPQGGGEEGREGEGQMSTGWAPDDSKEGTRSFGPPPPPLLRVRSSNPPPRDSLPKNPLALNPTPPGGLRPIPLRDQPSSTFLSSHI